MNTQNLTAEQAERIINGKRIIGETGLHKDVIVAHIGYTNGEGQPFTWEQSGEPYAIVSLKAVTDWQASAAEEDFINEEFDAAANRSLTFNANLDLAAKLAKGLPVDIVVDTYEKEVDGVMETRLRVAALTPPVAKAVVKMSLAERIAARKAATATQEQA